MRITRGIGIALTGVMMAAGLVTATASSASAAASDCLLQYVPVYNDSGLAGYALWNADPSSCANGDNLGAEDLSTDGYSVVAHLRKPGASVPDRVVTTSGYTAPVTVWKGGNLPEGDPYFMWACLSKNGVESHCTDMFTVIA